MKMKKNILIAILLLNTVMSFAQYNGGSGSGFVSGSSTAVTLSAFLQGPYSSGSMTTTLNTNNFIPLSQPYNTSPWNYTGTETVGSIPAGVVDWVLIELRRNTADSSTIQKRAAFILNDGTITDIDGTSPINFYSAGDISSYYVVIRHRNHLAVMSANSLSLTSSLSGSYLTGGNSEYDFSTAQTQAFGTNPMFDLGSGVLGMRSGDSNNSNIVTFSDVSGIISNNNQTGYNSNDINMSGIVTFADVSQIISNNNSSTQVP